MSVLLYSGAKIASAVSHEAKKTAVLLFNERVVPLFLTLAASTCLIESGPAQWLVPY